MNKLTGILLVLAILLAVNTQAQNDSTSAVSKRSLLDKMYLQLQVGIIASESNDTKDYRPAAGFGIGYELHHLFQPGVYIGYEEYRLFESMPVAVQLQGNFNPTTNSAFYYAQLGKTAMWKNSRNELQSVSSGEYWEAGIGYQWKAENLKLKLSAGFRDQKFTSVSKNSDIWYWDALSSFAPTQGYKEVTHWHLERMHFKFTIEF
ncbi:hypothetical protein [Fulvivirga lutea]|uniref:Outer membrane protein beta-barrel domain-containing protein n=1 Tax=Fulvivirga lutea TaxID=2810512 RepID=A0A974WF94_9BACT|nr:hypothetical protein [Fulvivirga lutea]QSE96885.1 hypothetical protein JR347_14985 [Fulvivirga lutea]